MVPPICCRRLILHICLHWTRCNNDMVISWLLNSVSVDIIISMKFHGLKWVNREINGSKKKKSQIYALHKPVYTREFNYLITKLPETSSVLLYYDDQQSLFQNGKIRHVGLSSGKTGMRYKPAWPSKPT